MKKNMWIALVAMMSLTLAVSSCRGKEPKTNEGNKNNGQEQVVEVTKLELQPAGDITLAEVGAEATVQAIVEPATAAVAFKIADEAIATVKADGKKATIKAVKSGETTLTVTAGKLTKSVKVTVKKKPAKTDMAPDTEMPYLGLKDAEMKEHESKSGRTLQKAKLEGFGGGEVEFYANKDCIAFQAVVYGVNYGDEQNSLIGCFAGVKEEAAVKYLLAHGYQKQIKDGTTMYVSQKSVFIIEKKKDGSKALEPEFQKFGCDANMIVLFDNNTAKIAEISGALKSLRR